MSTNNHDPTVVIPTDSTNNTISSNGHLPGRSNWKLQFNNVSYTGKQNNQTQKILKETFGEFRSGRLTAILGPSGAGKTSMLNVLSGFKAKGVTGNFLLNEKERHLLEFRKISCYIPQDFALLDLLTVKETLNVSVDLKLPIKTSKEEKQQIINNILQILNMDKCRNRLVRNLSGGERKRLSIAIELVTNPPVMFFDEPTSGLDSVASLQVVNYLSRLAHDGRIVVCVVHQPSSRLMQLFDDVVVLSHGEVLYCGPQREMIPHFEQSGFAFPVYYNPADFVLEVASEDHNDNIVNLIERNKQKYSREVKKTSDNPAEANETSKMLPNESSHTSIAMNHIDGGNNLTQNHHQHCMNLVRPKEQVTFWRQFSVLTRRSFRSMSRNLIAVQMRIIMHIVVALLLGAVFWDIGNDGAHVMSNSSCIFFLVLFVFFGNAMPSILLCPQDTAVFIREYLNGWYSIGAYYLSKIIADIPMQFACPTFFISIVYFMTGQPDDMALFAMCWGICLLTGFIGHFIGLVFGSTFEMQMAIFLVPGVTIPFMIFSGFFIRLHELNGILRPICDISFFRYTMEGFMQAIYGYGRPDLACNTDFCYFKSPTKFLKEMDMLGDLYGWDLLALLMWIIFLKVLFFLSLVFRIRKAQ